MTDQEDWMERLKNLILDDNQVVTYKVASRELGVHVNNAKQMLFALAEADNSFDVLYLVSGRDSEGRLIVKVTSSDHQLASVTSKHVYAVAAKGKANARDVLSADMTASVMPSKHGAIGNKKAVPRQRTQGQEESKSVKVAATKDQKQVPKNESKPVAKNDGKTVAKNDSKPVAKNDSKPAPAVKSSNNTSKGTAAVKSNSLKGMFEKAAASRKTVKKEEPAIKKEDDKESSPGKENRLNEEKEEKSMTATNGVSKSKKRQKKDSSSSGVNKRRRIQVMSDSEESADEKEDEEVEEDEAVKECDEEVAPPQAKLIQSDSEEDDIVPPTPESSTKSKVTNGDTKEPSKRARIKKRVTKTYVDETGFLCTKQEMQSCSESEGEVEQKKDSPAKNKPKDSPTKNKPGSEEKKQETAKAKAKAQPANSSGTKQASIMNFFKKK